MKFSTFAPVLAVAGLCVSAQAANVSLTGEFKTAYVATGATCNDGFVFNPDIYIDGLKIGDTDLPLSFDVWGNVDLDDDYDPESYKAGRFSEIDLEVALDLGAFWTPSENFSWSVGYLEYDYPQPAWNPDHLIDFNMGYSDGFVNPAFQVKYRFAGDSKEKCEFRLKLSHSWDLGNDFGFGLTADCWYIIQAPESELDDGFACADFTAKLSFQHLFASCTYVCQLDDDVLTDEAYDVDWIGAVGIGYDF